MKIKKALSVISAATIIIVGCFATMINVNAESIFDEVYNNHYYKHIFANNTTEEYVLSSDDSLYGYTIIDIGGNSNKNKSNKTIKNNLSDFQSINEETISHGYKNFENKSKMDSLIDDSFSNDLYSKSFRSRSSYDSRVVRILVESFDGKYNAGTGFIIQDWNGKSCIATAGHNINSQNSFPKSVKIEIYGDNNKYIESYYADAMHVTKEQHDGNSAVCYDYALLTIPNISLANKYGYYYIATIGENSKSEVNLKGIDGNINQNVYSGRITDGSYLTFNYDVGKTTFGNSGGPVIIKSGENDFVVAIHSGLGWWPTTSIGARTSWAVTRFLAFNPLA